VVNSRISTRITITSVSTQTTKKRVTDLKCILMETTTRDFSKTGSEVALALLSGHKAKRNMKELGKITTCTAKEFSHGLMAENTKVNTRIIYSTVSANYLTKAVELKKAPGVETSVTASSCTLTSKEQVKLSPGTMVRQWTTELKKCSHRSRSQLWMVKWNIRNRLLHWNQIEATKIGLL
jgi:hypothetical protein